MSDFIHLHTHSHYSIRDGVSKIEEIIAKVQEYKQPAVALTDHGNMFGAMELTEKAFKHGIKPIYGCEFYLAPQSRFQNEKNSERRYYHLVLLAKNNVGYRNLLQLTSIGYLEGFRYRPRIDKNVLREHSEGLIALTGCIAGEIPSLILQEKEGDLQKAIEWYIDTFGKENLFLELQNHHLPDEQKVLKRLIELSKTTGLKYVATNDAHYISKEDAILQEILFAISDKTTLNDEKRRRYPNNEFYLKSSEEMKNLFSEIPKAITQTRLIGEMCEFELKFGNYLPVFPLPKGENADSYLRHLALTGLASRLNGNPSDEYYKRLDLELDMVKSKGLSNYFLVVNDFVNYARRKGILVGPGRGSAAGALISYALGITNVDPIQYGLFFERFLNPERSNMPDIDIDFQDDRRDEVKEYIRSRYGYDKTADIITFGLLKSRAALTDVGRVLNIDLAKVRSITKLIDNQLANLEFKQVEEAVPEILALRTKGSPIEKKWIEYSERLDGTIRNIGTHASGVIISNTPLTEIVPLYKDQESKVIYTQFEGQYLEKNGLLKMDILGLKNLTVIQECLSRIKRNHHIKLDINRIPLDDQKVYELFWRGHTMGIFQFESEGMTTYLKQLRPTCIDDLIAMNALYRPGPMDNILTYINRKHGREQVDYYHEDLEPILKPTYGIIVYQEQVMQIAQVLAGFTLGQADLLRRAMAKKDRSKLSELRPQWIEGSVARGYSKSLAEQIFDLLVPFSSYAFNKSHSAAYSILAYQTAYLKKYYPLEFMSALLTINMANSEDVHNYCRECAALNIRVVPPDINRSQWEFSEQDGEILFGFGGIKGMGESAAQMIIRERELGGKFNSFKELVERMVKYDDFKKPTLEVLIKSGALDSIIPKDHYLKEKAILLSNIDSYVDQIADKEKEKSFGQLLLFENTLNNNNEPHINRNVQPLSMQQDFINELETLGFYLSGKIFKNYRHKIGDISRYSHSLAHSLQIGTGISLWGYFSEVIVKRDVGNRDYAIVDFDNRIDTFRFYIFSEKYERFRDYLYPNKFVLVRLVIDEGKRGSQYEVIKITPLELVSQGKEVFTELHILIDNPFQCNGIKNQLIRLRDLVSDVRNRGQLKLIFHTTDNNRPVTLKSAERFSTSYSPRLIEQVKKLPNLLGYWLY